MTVSHATHRFCGPALAATTTPGGSTFVLGLIVTVDDTAPVSERLFRLAA